MDTAAPALLEARHIGKRFGGITALSGVITYALHGDVSVKYAAVVGVPAAFGAVGGTSLQRRLHGRTIELRFAALMVGTAVWLFVK